MFEKFRQMKATLWVTASGFMVFVFVVWGIGDEFGSRNNRNPNEIGRVNGQSIPGHAYQQVVDSQRRQLQQQGSREIDEKTDLSIRSQSWNTLVTGMLTSQEATRLGLGVSDKEVVEAVLNSPERQLLSNPNFQTDNQFDLSKYQAFIHSLDDQTLSQLEASTREQIPSAKLGQLVMGTAIVSDAELWNTFRLQHERVRVDALLLPASKFNVDPSSISEADAEAYYRAHRRSYSAAPQASVQWVLFPRKYTQTDSLTIVEQMRSAIDEYKSGEDWLTVVDSYSEAPDFQRGGPNAPLLPPAQLPGAIRQAAATLPVGQISDLLIDKGGFHVVRIEERSSDAVNVQVRVADLYMPLTPQPETLEEIRTQVQEFRQECVKRNFAEVAAEFKVRVEETRPFGARGFIAGFGSFPEVQQFAFSNEVGAISAPMERNEGWYIVRVSRRSEARVPDFSEIAEQVRRQCADSLKTAQAVQAAAGYFARAQAGEPLESIAKSDPSLVQRVTDPISRTDGIPGVGRDPVVAGMVFAAPLGLIPRILPATSGALIVNVLEHQAADQAQFESQKAQLRQGALQRKQNEVYSAWMEQLQHRAKIEDYRSGTF